jgi:hypothetical protein
MTKRGQRKILALEENPILSLRISSDLDTEIDTKAIPTN